MSLLHIVTITIPVFVHEDMICVSDCDICFPTRLNKHQNMKHHAYGIRIGSSSTGSNSVLSFPLVLPRKNGSAIACNIPQSSGLDDL